MGYGMSRTETLLRNLPKTARVIEVGPSYNGLVPKRDGWNTVIVDHASREELVIKYGSNNSINASNIEDVDYIWQGGSLAELIPADQHGTFDAFIASHVIEHTTDIVTFLESAGTLIRPDGLIILAVPDKRKCFDAFRYPSTTFDAVQAFEEKRSVHDRRTHFEYGMRMSNKAGLAGWTIDDTRESVFAVPFDHAKSWLQIPNGKYIDAHNWVFVPASFDLLMLELGVLGYLNVHIDSIMEANEIEFYVWLKKGRINLNSEEVQEERLKISNRIVVELAEQSRQIPGSPLATKA